MSGRLLELRVGLELDPGADAAEVEERTLQFRGELLELDVDDVREPSAGPPIERVKGADAALIGTVVVTAGRGAISAVVRVLAGFLSRAGAAAHRTSANARLPLPDD